jgi:hypothetical protein
MVNLMQEYYQKNQWTLPLGNSIVIKAIFKNYGENKA